MGRGEIFAAISVCLQILYPDIVPTNGPRTAHAGTARTLYCPRPCESLLHETAVDS